MLLILMIGLLMNNIDVVFLYLFADTDEKNCGACGHSCGRHEECHSGKCYCSYSILTPLLGICDEANPYCTHDILLPEVQLCICPLPYWHQCNYGSVLLPDLKCVPLFITCPIPPILPTTGPTTGPTAAPTAGPTTGPTAGPSVDCEDPLQELCNDVCVDPVTFGTLISCVCI